MYSCFYKKKEKVQFVQEQLLELKGFPLTTENDKNLKIAAIFEKIDMMDIFILF